ncbi:MAG: hypothetical protein HIU88_12765 [Acidobacteria bacterium]|nr:hypothetical protein [Acidobacteriota bacterium]
MTKVRAFAAYVATVVLLLLGLVFVWQFHIMMIQPLSGNTTVLVYGVGTQLWVYDLVVAVLAAASFAGAVMLMIRQPRANRSAA